MKKIITSILAFLLVFANANTKIRANESTYEIFPMPHSIQYLDGQTIITDEINIVNVGGVSTENIALLKGLFHDKLISETSSVVDGKTNIIIAKSEHAFFTENNAILGTEGYDRHTVLVKDNIGIIAENDASIFYGIQTLKAILKKQPTLRNVLIKDYADVKYRGFIEGYYGFPWSHENRLSLMEFAGQFKANTYIFAPKDDVYHSSQWRTLYPQSEQAKIMELVNKGKETGTKFVWTLHPFISGQRLNFNNFDQEMDAMKAKFEQLYTLGVRQFGVLADDVGQVDRNQLVRMLRVLSEWAISKQDVEDILFCPAGYNHAWQGNYDELKKLNEAPDNVQIFWTGDTVVNVISQNTVNNFKNRATVNGKVGRDPFIWLNWPVNDYKKGRLLLGPGYVMQPGVTNLIGVVTNPMTEAQPSKVGIFATVNYAWNTRDFNADNVWEQGFQFIDQNASEALKIIAEHLQDVAPSGHGLVLDESVKLKDKIADIDQALNTHASDLTAKVNALLPDMNQIVEAVDNFNQNASNLTLKAEMQPWLNALKYQSQATIAFLKAIIADSKAEQWQIMQEGMQLDELAKAQKRDIFPTGQVNVEVGAKRLAPLKEKLLGHLNQVVNPQNGNGFEKETEAVTPFISNDIKVVGGNLAMIVDGNSDTYINLKQNVNSGGDLIPANAYVGVQFNSAVSISEIQILQTRPGASNDKFAANSVLEYSLDGNTYHQIALVSDATFNQNVNIRAKYVRLRNATQIPFWASIKEFKVTTAKQYPVITNSNLDDVSYTIQNNSFKLNNTITLQPNEYVIMDLQRIREISSIDGDIGSLTIEYSKNNVVYHDDEDTARYVKLINKTDSPITQALDLEVMSNEIYPVSVLETNVSSYEGLLNAFDQNENNKAWLKNSQIAGKYVIYDLGQEVAIQQLKLSVNDSENDWLRHGQIEASTDLNTWQPLLSVDASDDEDITTAYPFYSAPTRYQEANLATPITARYLKLSVTQSKVGDDKWIRFNEILINNGQYLQPENRPQIVTKGDEDTSINNKFMLDDKTLKTSYHSKTPGEIIYYVDHPSEYKSLTLLTSGNEEMRVAVLDQAEQWHDLGTISENYTRFNLDAFRHVLAVKLTWENSSRHIHEILFDEYRPYLSRYELGNITTNTQETRSGGEGYIEYAFDGKVNTLWHSLWDTPINADNPAIVEIPLLQPENLTSIVYIPRANAGYNGLLEQYEIQAQINGQYQTVKEGTLPLDKERKEIIFDEPLRNVEAIKIIVKKGYNNFASASEFVLKREKPLYTANENAISLLQEIANYTQDLQNTKYFAVENFANELDNAFQYLIKGQLSDKQLTTLRQTLANQHQALERILVYVKNDLVDIHAEGIFSPTFEVTVTPQATTTEIKNVLTAYDLANYDHTVFDIHENESYKHTTFQLTFKPEKVVKAIVHILNDGNVEIFDNLVVENNQITINTNALSTYVVVYQDKLQPTIENRPEIDSNIQKTTTNVKSDVEHKVVADTSDRSNAIFYLGSLLLSLLLLVRFTHKAKNEKAS